MCKLRLYLSSRREQLGYSFRKTSSLVGIDLHHYHLIETGEVDRVGFLLMCKIAYVLEIKLEDMYAYESEYFLQREE